MLLAEIGTAWSLPLSGVGNFLAGWKSNASHRTLLR
jgi:hypothetical protein